MNITKNFVFAIIVSTLLFFSACGGDTTTNTGTYSPYIGGMDSVTAEFMAGMPPTARGSLLDLGQTPFSIGIQITNDGEFDINSESEGDFFQAELKGIQPRQFDITNEDLIIPLDVDLKGARKNNVDGSIIRGQKTQLIFEDLNYLDEVPGDTPISFTVGLCYDYGTKSSTRICVADDATKATINEEDQAICNVEGTKNVINSAGPLQVVNVAQTISGKDKVSVGFEIQKTGLGKIFLFDSNDACSESSENRANANKVKVVVSLPSNSGTNLACNGFEQVGNNYEKIINLYEDTVTPTMFCTVSGESGGDKIYEDTINIDLYYRYSHNIKTEVFIKHSGYAYE